MSNRSISKLILTILFVTIFLVASSQTVFNATNGRTEEIGSLMNSKGLLIYWIPDNPCAKCVEDILNYGYIEEGKSVPSLLIIENASIESIKSSIDINRKSMMIQSFKRSYFVASSSDFKRILSYFHVPLQLENQNIYLESKGKHILLKENLISFLGGTF